VRFPFHILSLQSFLLALLLKRSQVLADELDGHLVLDASGHDYICIDALGKAEGLKGRLHEGLIPVSVSLLHTSFILCLHLSCIFILGDKRVDGVCI
jgi:hypothetical protein